MPDFLSTLDTSTIIVSLISIAAVLVLLLRGLVVLSWERIGQSIAVCVLICAAGLFYDEFVSIDALKIGAMVIVGIIAGAVGVDLILDGVLWVQERFAARREARAAVAPYFVEIWKALDMLIARESGALILIEREDTLEKYLHGGIAYDGIVKAEILVAIFMSASPVHDGAVVISDGMITMVKGVISKLGNIVVPQGVGTRHRAAISITKRTDTIAIIVSEERGTVSVALRGKLITVNSKKDFLETIQRGLKR